jgi:hypothetical protein
MERVDRRAWAYSLLTPLPVPTRSGNPVVRATVRVADNHGHGSELGELELSMGSALVVEIAGDAGHNHRVVLSASEVAAIRSGRTVTKRSSETFGHTHFVIFN